MKLFIYALADEAKGLLSEVKILTTKKLGYTRVHEVEARGEKILVAIAGMGKAFAAAGLAAVLTAYEGQIDEVYNLGIGGSIDASIAPVFSFVVSKGLYEHDLDTSEIGDPFGFISGIEIIEIPASETLADRVIEQAHALNLQAEKAVITSGDTFFGKKEDYERVHAWNGAICFDMESAPFGQIAYVYQVPYVAVRCISDAGDGGEYAKNKPHACGLLKDLVLALVK